MCPACVNNGDRILCRLYGRRKRTIRYYIGQNGSADLGAEDVPDVMIDDLIVFDGALGEEEIRSLRDYYLGSGN